MPAISLRAHFDGESIQLDEPYPLPNDAKLLVTVLPPDADPSPATTEPQLTDWASVSASGLARAYGASEPEYSPADVIQ